MTPDLDALIAQFDAARAREQARADAGLSPLITLDYLSPLAPTGPRPSPETLTDLKALVAQFEAERHAEAEADASWRRRTATPPVGTLADEDAIPF